MDENQEKSPKIMEITAVKAGIGVAVKMELSQSVPPQTQYEVFMTIVKTYAEQTAMNARAAGYEITKEAVIERMIEDLSKAKEEHTIVAAGIM